METRIAIVDTKVNSLNSSFERHVNDYRSLRSTFTNVTVGLVALIFGVSAAYVGGVHSLSSNQGSLSQQQKQFGEKQIEIAQQQNETNQEMREIKDQLVKINQSMDIILKEHASFHK